MDISTIASIRSLAAENYARMATEKRSVESNEEKSRQNSQEEEKTPDDIYDILRLRNSFMEDVNLLSKTDAIDMITTLAPLIAQAPSWKLSEIQAIAESALIQPTYV